NANEIWGDLRAIWRGPPKVNAQATETSSGEKPGWSANERMPASARPFSDAWTWACFSKPLACGNLGDWELDLKQP
ncbi:hypothetical protein L916_21714, partial [Phytophthora nicotianae]